LAKPGIERNILIDILLSAESDLRFMIQDLRITINNKNICGGHCGSTSPSNEGGR